MLRFRVSCKWWGLIVTFVLGGVGLRNCPTVGFEGPRGGFDKVPESLNPKPQTHNPKPKSRSSG